MMPQGAEPLSVEAQNDTFVLFALVDPEAKPEPRIFRVVTTGEVFNPEDSVYIDTAFIDWYTAHVFEVLGPAEDPIEDRFQDDMRETRKIINV